MKWIDRLFGAKLAGHRLPHTNGPEAGAAAPPGVQLANIDAMFYRWVARAGELDASPSTEKLILDELGRLVESPSSGASLVPRVPEVIPRLLRSLRDDGITGADLARQLAQDVVLVAEVIREVNSPYYRPTVPVRNLEGAVMLLGQNGLRMLLARVSFRPIISMQAGYFARMVAPQTWSQSEKCALAASLLATRTGVVPFEAYLAGLMQNVGLIVVFRLIDHISAEQLLPHSDEFCVQMYRQARTLSARIAGLWDFPASVAEAIEQVGRPDAPPLARVLEHGDRIAKLRMMVDAGLLDPAVIHAEGPAATDVFNKIKTVED